VKWQIIGQNSCFALSERDASCGDIWRYFLIWMYSGWPVENWEVRGKRTGLFDSFKFDHFSVKIARQHPETSRRIWSICKRSLIHRIEIPLSNIFSLKQSIRITATVEIVETSMGLSIRISV
jgi:hypothetical protein